MLLPLMSTMPTIPEDVAVTSHSPGTDFIDSARRILLVLGPGIGIGDEIILFSLAARLKATNPDAQITVLSAYQRLWDRVGAVDENRHYADYLELLRALRNGSEPGSFDLVVLADFERPDLYEAIWHEPDVGHYIELSLGGQSVFVIDGQRQWLHRARVPVPYFANYYAGLNYLMDWLGLAKSVEPESTTGATGVIARGANSVHAAQQKPSDGSLNIYVNPFTAKYDPSPVYWSHLLSALFPIAPSDPVCVVIDPGTNRTTERFAYELTRSAAARTPPGVEFAVAQRESGVPSHFEAIFSQLEWAHVLISSDSFPVHASPLVGCTTLVVAEARLENWRVPHPLSYYFDSTSPVEEVAAGMRQVLDGMARRDSRPAPPQVSGAESRLETATQVLQELLGRGQENLNGNFAALWEAYQEFMLAYQEAISRLAAWPGEFDSLLSDFSYGKLAGRAIPQVMPPEALRSDFIFHLLDRWQRWNNTNLRKYLGLVLDGTT
ncbi:MAG: hypothetical protein M3441_01570 [Chloroflexota bacterium]|nr:hypothetical protein [Chloroflexota bacterium]